MNRKVYESKMHSVKITEFFVTQILREIKFGESRGSKSAISTHSMDLNFDICEFLHFLKVQIYQIDKIQCPQYCQTCYFRNSRFSKIDFT